MSPAKTSPLTEWNLPDQNTPPSNDISHGGHPPRMVHRGAACSQEQGSNARLRHGVREQLVENIYFRRDPFNAANASRHDHGYPHSNLRASFVRGVMQIFQPTLWVEVGSFIGSSAVTTAAVAAHLCLKDLSIVSIDPFTGDQMMWDLHRFAKLDNVTQEPIHRWGYDFLQFTPDGRPTIRDRFMANVLVAGAAPWVLPLTMPGLIGMRLVKILHGAQKISTLPQVLFLDSAHAADETRMELESAIQTLAPGGLLFGDDWSWAAVKADVTAFANVTSSQKYRLLHKDEPGVHREFARAQADHGVDCTWPHPAVMLCAPHGGPRGQGQMWCVFKGPGVLRGR